MSELDSKSAAFAEAVQQACEALGVKVGAADRRNLTRYAEDVITGASASLSLSCDGGVQRTAFRSATSGGSRNPDAPLGTYPAATGHEW